jgi:hypothetical protein
MNRDVPEGRRERKKRATRDAIAATAVSRRMRRVDRVQIWIPSSYGCS